MTLLTTKQSEIIERSFRQIVTNNPIIHGKGEGEKHKFVGRSSQLDECIRKIMNRCASHAEICAGTAVGGGIKRWKKKRDKLDYVAVFFHRFSPIQNVSRVSTLSY
jgi:hypothetical protein